MNKRSIGITIVGWLEVVCGVLGIVWNLLILLHHIYGREPVIINGHSSKIVLYYFPAIIPIAILTLGNGLLSLRKWAWQGNVYVLPWLSLLLVIIYSRWKGHWISELTPLSFFYFGLLFLLIIFLALFLGRKNVAAQCNNQSISKCPVGLSILGWFQIIMGLFGVLFVAVISLYPFGYMLNGIKEGHLSMKEAAHCIIFSTDILFVVALSGFLFSVGVGILKLKKWAWFVNWFIYPVMYLSLYLLIFLIYDHTKFLPLTLLWILVYVLSNAYLCLPHVREKFFHTNAS